MLNISQSSVILYCMSPFGCIFSIPSQKLLLINNMKLCVFIELKLNKIKKN